MLLYAGLCGAQLISVWRATGGAQLYSLDDPYIHAAIAKNLAQHGVYGVTRHEFAFSASSVLWPFLLAAIYLLTGVHAATPLLVNALAAIGTLLAADMAFRYWTGERGSTTGNALQLALLTVAASLIGLTFIGMEHTLQVLTCLMFLHHAARAYEEASDRRIIAPLCAWAALASLVRYEGLFLAAAIALLFALARNWKFALFTGLASGFPLAAFGVYEKLHGGWWLPIPLLLKPEVPAVRTIARFATSRGLLAPDAYLYALTPLWVLAVVLWVPSRRWTGLRRGHRFMLAAFVLTTLLHLDLARTGWLFRYEAYLVAMGIFSIMVAVTAAWRTDSKSSVRLRWVVWSASAFIALPYVLFAHLPERLTLAMATAAAILVASWLLLRRLRFSRAAGLQWGLRGTDFGTLLGVLVVGMVSLRAQGSYQVIPAAAVAIYQQQYQMARFLHSHYPAGHVAVNDIGAINFFNDLYCLDLYGLGSARVTELKRKGAFTAESISGLAQEHQIEVAVGYENWLGGPDLPPDWLPVATWSIERQHDLVILQGTTITFYGVGESNAALLRSRLQEFEASLPAGVTSDLRPRRVPSPERAPEPR